MRSIKKFKFFSSKFPTPWVKIHQSFRLDSKFSRTSKSSKIKSKLFKKSRLINKKLLINKSWRKNKEKMKKFKSRSAIIELCHARTTMDPLVVKEATFVTLFMQFSLRNNKCPVRYFNSTELKTWERTWSMESEKYFRKLQKSLTKIIQTISNFRITSIHTMQRQKENQFHNNNYHMVDLSQCYKVSSIISFSNKCNTVLNNLSHSRIKMSSQWSFHSYSNHSSLNSKLMQLTNNFKLRNCISKLNSFKPNSQTTSHLHLNVNKL